MKLFEKLFFGRTNEDYVKGHSMLAAANRSEDRWAGALANPRAPEHALFTPDEMAGLILAAREQEIAAMKLLGWPCKDKIRDLAWRKELHARR